MIEPPQHYHPSPPKIKGHEILPPLQEELYHPQIHTPGIKGLGNGKKGNTHEEARINYLLTTEKIQGEIQAPEITPKEK